MAHTRARHMPRTELRETGAALPGRMALRHAQAAAELQARISRIVTRWDAGRGLPTRLKQEFISTEKRNYDREKARAK